MSEYKDRCDEVILSRSYGNHSPLVSIEMDMPKNVIQHYSDDMDFQPKERTTKRMPRKNPVDEATSAAIAHQARVINGTLPMSDIKAELALSVTTDSPAKSAWKDMSSEQIINAMIAINESLQPKPTAYIVTPSRGDPYLVFAGSTAHDDAALFKYDMRPLYE